jgi:Contractile injection system tube protein
MALTRGKLLAQEGGQAGTAVEFMFNPTEYSVTKRNNWTYQDKKAGNVPAWEFGGGGPRELQLELFFDTSLPRPGGGERNLRKVTNQLFAFMLIDPRLKNQAVNSQLGRPPRCRLEWGRDTPFHFECYVTDCTVKFMLFTEDGVPVRATAALTLKEVKDPESLARQNPTSGGEPGRRLHVVSEGERLDWIAYLEYGDAAEWKRIADANRLHNPLDLRPGMTLTIPPLQSSESVRV